MAAPKKKTAPAVAPWQELRDTLPKITNDELVQLVLFALEEGATRLENYSELFEGVRNGQSRKWSWDVLNEAIAFGNRMGRLVVGLSPEWRMAKSWRRVHEANNELARAFEMAERWVTLGGKGRGAVDG